MKVRYYMKEQKMESILNYTPSQFYEYIKKYIKYGFVDKYMNKYYVEDFDKVDIDKIYVLQTPMQVITNKCAWCWDVVELIRYYINSNKMEAETYYLEYKDDAKNRHNTHTFIVYKQEDFWYNMEDNSSNSELGIYKYSSKESAIENISNSFQNWIKEIYNLESLDDKFICNKYEQPTFGISAIEFQNWCKKNSEE